MNVGHAAELTSGDISILLPNALATNIVQNKFALLELMCDTKLKYDNTKMSRR